MDFLLDGLKNYSIAWFDALEREHQIDNGSALNNLLYCVSKLASVRCFGKKGIKSI